MCPAPLQLLLTASNPQFAQHKDHIVGVTRVTIEAIELDPGSTYEARLRVQMATLEGDDEEERYEGQWSDWSLPVCFRSPQRRGVYCPPDWAGTCLCSCTCAPCQGPLLEAILSQLTLLLEAGDGTRAQTLGFLALYGRLEAMGSRAVPMLHAAVASL